MDKISAWMDGELDEAQARQQLSRIRSAPELREVWDEFHLIGDALRGEPMLSRQFGQRLADRLAREPTVLAPRNRRRSRIIAYTLSAAASLSAIALVGWVALYDNPLTPGPELATVPVAAPPAAVAAAQPASVPSDGRMHEYLFAHHEYSPSTRIQGLAPYIRSVSSSQPLKGR